MTDTLKSPDMSPKEFAPVWKCRHCRHRWLIVDEGKPPKQCPNRKCRRMDWDRPKKKEGRPGKRGPKVKAKARKIGRKGNVPTITYAQEYEAEAVRVHMKAAIDLHIAEWCKRFGVKNSAFGAES